MKIKGERVIYKRSLRNPINIGILDYELWSITEKKSVSFLSEVMDRNMDDAEKFLKSMGAELPSQVQRMFTIYIVKNEPVGVVFPHLEPDKDNEGRISLAKGCVSEIKDHHIDGLYFRDEYFERYYLTISYCSNRAG
ncbi:hypothetical protein [Paucisalibacillus sp. EB02]|uniref:hypothetical protein n=1 Tax=Paucisalibacillus sp. EB02 TaxID=1347087 RepID=UPI00069323E6|nr:hypothetical protein [Paucisalibacillus sp. EB02]